MSFPITSPSSPPYRCPYSRLMDFSCLSFSTFIPNMRPQLTCLVLSLPVFYVSSVTSLITQQHCGAALLPWVSATPFTLAVHPAVCISTPSLSSCSGMFGCPWCLQLQTTFLEYSPLSSGICGSLSLELDLWNHKSQDRCSDSLCQQSEHPSLVYEHPEGRRILPH